MSVFGTVVSQVNQRGQQMTGSKKGGAPDRLFDPTLPASERRLPPGVATFGAPGSKEAPLGTRALVHVYLGHPYNSKGEKLPADSKWLKENGFVCDDNVKRVLFDQQNKVRATLPSKQCSQCGSNLLAESKFCHSCGTPQALASDLWLPGSADEDGARIAALVNDDDPFAQFAISQKPPEAPRLSPQEIFELHQRSEQAAVNRDLSLRPGAAQTIGDGGGTGEVALAVGNRQTINVSRSATGTLVPQLG